MITAVSDLPTKPKIARDQWDRPLIQTLDGQIRGYTRSSTLGNILANEEGLTQWKLRMVAIGLASRPDLILAVNAHRDDHRVVGEIVAQAMDAAEAGAAATTGTALHALCDQYDAGRTPYVPEEYVPDIAAYQHITRKLDVVSSECFCVCDQLSVGGTPDRICRLRAPLWAPAGLPGVEPGTVLVEAGELIVVDIKTGAKLKFGQIKFSVQFAVYSRSQLYDISAGRTVTHKGKQIPVGDRRPFVAGETVNQDWGLIVHLPAGTGAATLHPVKLRDGWEVAKLAVAAQEQGKRKDLIGPATVLMEDYAALAMQASSVYELHELYVVALADGAWNDDLRTVFTAARIAIESESVAS